MKKLKQNYHFLNILSRSSPAQKRTLLRTANKGQILTLREICLNVLSGNVPSPVKRLRKYRNALRKVAKKSTKLAHKKKIFIIKVVDSYQSYCGQLVLFSLVY